MKVSKILTVFVLDIHINMKHLLLDKILPGQEALKSNKGRKKHRFYREQG